MNGDVGIVNGFVAARLAARPLAAFPGTVPATLAAAYQCQDAAIARWPDGIAGWKVARVGGEWRHRYVEDRMIGPVFSRNVHRVAAGEEAQCPVFAGGFAAVEAEIGIVVAHDAPSGRTDWNAASARELVGAMCTGAEIASSPLPTLNDLGPGAVVADFGNNWGVVIGLPIPHWSANVAPVEVATFIDGAQVGEGRVALDAAPLEALAFAANRAAERGKPLRAGGYISTGMITGVHDIRPGQSARLVFEGCGELRCRIRAQRPLPAAGGAQ